MRTPAHSLPLGTGLKATWIPLLLASLIACTTGTHLPNAIGMCPGVRSIEQVKQQEGYSYYAISPGGGWSGENPQAQEHYLKGLVFESAAILTVAQSPTRPEYHFVACDYVGPEPLAFLRLAKHFPDRPRAVGPNWTAQDYCEADSVEECQFTVLNPLP